MKGLCKLGPLVLVGAFAACGANTQAGTNTSRPTPDAQVYAAVLNHLFPKVQGGPDRQFVISGGTSQTSKERFVPEYWTAIYGIPGMDSALVQNFQERGGVTRSLAPLGQLLQELLERITAPSPRRSSMLVMGAVETVVRGG